MSRWGGGIRIEQCGWRESSQLNRVRSEFAVGCARSSPSALRHRRIGGSESHDRVGSTRQGLRFTGQPATLPCDRWTRWRTNTDFGGRSGVYSPSGHVWQCTLGVCQWFGCRGSEYSTARLFLLSFGVAFSYDEESAVAINGNRVSAVLGH